MTTKYALMALVTFLAVPVSYGQQYEHDLYHAQYEKWSSDITANCCDNVHCGVIDDDHLRENGDHLEVLIADPKGDQWCPVTPGHLIKQSNGPRLSPDASHAHACIYTGDPYSAYPTCQRFVCFMDKVRD